MLVTNYQYAHLMVEKNNNLSWDGWDIVEFKPNQSAEYKVDGKLVNGVWGFTKVFSPTREGWEIPNKYVR